MVVYTCNVIGSSLELNRYAYPICENKIQLQLELVLELWQCYTDEQPLRSSGPRPVAVERRQRCTGLYPHH